MASFSSEERYLEDWIKGEFLGRGAHGEVYMYTHRYTREVLAMKKVNIQPLYAERHANGLKKLRNEIDILKKLRHERIVAYHQSVEKEKHLYLFMEYMTGGSLLDKIMSQRHGVLSEDLSRNYTQQILEGVCYLHSQEIVHRDIKGANILLDENGDVKLADFGVARKFGKMGSKANLVSCVGSSYWMAPEVILGKPYGWKADNWSIGCTVVEMMTGLPPLGHMEPVAAIFRVGSKPFEPESVKGASLVANKFIRVALTWDAKDRPQSHELLKHPFICGSTVTREDHEKQASSDTLSREVEEEQTERLRDLEDWIEDKSLGSGAFGQVYMYTHRYTREVLAVKKVNIQPLYAERHANELKRLRNEIDILKKLRHERIVAYHQSVETEKHLYLFMEYMTGGSLGDKIKSQMHGVLSEDLSRKYTQQILEGVCYLHSQQIVHRGIKGDNVLLDDNGDAKLAGFGLAKKIEKIGNKTNLESQVGTPCWMAPEVISGGTYGRKADNWSVGCTVVEMMTGRPPLAHMDPIAAMFRVGSKPFEPESVKGASLVANKFIRMALTWDAKDRPQSHELLKHPFICGSTVTREDHEKQASSDTLSREVEEEQTERLRDLEDWIEDKSLGSGAFGQVYMYTHRYTREVLAVKKVNIQPLYAERHANELKRLRNEIDILKKLRHERIVAYHQSVETEKHLYLFMEYMTGGSLGDKIKSQMHGVLSEDLSRKYTQQILEGVCYLHSQQIVHRGIKGDNVLLDDNGDAKLAGFGLAKKIEKIGNKTNLESQVGTPCWMAPEVISGGTYGRKADNWSVGCTVVEMMTGRPPLGHMEPLAAMFRVGSQTFEPESVKGASLVANNFIRVALTWDPKDRPQSHELLKHRFICGSTVIREDHEKQTSTLNREDEEKQTSTVYILVD